MKWTVFSETKAPTMVLVSDQGRYQKWEPLKLDTRDMLPKMLHSVAFCCISGVIVKLLGPLLARKWEVS